MTKDFKDIDWNMDFNPEVDLPIYYPMGFRIIIFKNEKADPRDNLEVTKLIIENIPIEFGIGGFVKSVHKRWMENINNDKK